MIGAGTNAGALLVDGLGDGLLLEAPDKDFDFLRNTSFNLLQGCRMRNTKTVMLSKRTRQESESIYSNSTHFRFCVSLPGICIMPILWQNFIRSSRDKRSN